jgi:DNA repair protein RadC
MRLDTLTWSNADEERSRAAVPISTQDPPALLVGCFRRLNDGRGQELAETLLARFGSLSGVLGASREALAAAAGEDAAEELVLLKALAVRLAWAEITPGSLISSWTALLAYVGAALRHERREQFRVLFLDNRNQLIRDELLGQGTLDHAPVYPREVIRRALELSAANLILVHNHPTGDPTPSRADIDMTKQVVEAGRLLKIQVHDHLIVGRQGVASFKSLGLL